MRCLASRHIVSLPVIVLLAVSVGPAAEPKVRFARPKVDLRPEFEKRKLDVRQQGKRGVCQVFAFVGVLEYQVSKPGRPVDLSEQFLMWAANDASGVVRIEGHNPDFLIQGLEKHGICLESAMPYVPRKEPIEEPSDKAKADAATTHTHCELVSIKHWKSDIGFTDDHMQKLTDYLDKRQPITVTLCWPQGLYDKQIVDTRYFLVDRNVDGASKNGHGVILVGYGLDKKVDGGGYFIARNAWGREFADKGYLGVTFDYAKKYGTDAYFVKLDEPAAEESSKTKTPTKK